MACLLLIPGAGSYWFPSQAQPCDVSANRKKRENLKKKTKFHDHSSRSCASLPVAPLFSGSDSDRLIPAKNEDMFIICSRSLFLLLGMRRIRCMCKPAVRLGVLISLSFKPCLIKGKHDKQPPEWDSTLETVPLKYIVHKRIVKVPDFLCACENCAINMIKPGLGTNWNRRHVDAVAEEFLFFKCVFHQKRTMLLLPLNLSCACYYIHYLLSKARKFILARKRKKM